MILNETLKNLRFTPRCFQRPLHRGMTSSELERSLYWQREVHKGLHDVGNPGFRLGTNLTEGGRGDRITPQDSSQS